MNIAVIGTGYVGLVTGACFADMGNKVICVDKDNEKIENLKIGIIPIWEPGLEEIVKCNFKKERLLFTTEIAEAVNESDIVFIAVGTPSEEDGSADLKYVLEVAKSIGDSIDSYKVIVDKSTVPVGTADKVTEVIRDSLSKRGLEIDFDVVSNPEFLREGSAIKDFTDPDRVIIGFNNERANSIMKDLYLSSYNGDVKIISMSVRSAEMTKYAANAMLATKISFINEIAQISERVGADITEVREGIGSDNRIGYSFIYPGVGFGGSCFPKDLRALIKTAKDNDVSSTVLTAVEERNKLQKQVLYHKIVKRFGHDLSSKTFAVWGLSFKPQTDDMREAPSIVIIDLLLKAGAILRLFDPVALEVAKKVLPDHKNILYFEDQYELLEGVDSLLLITEWKHFVDPDFSVLKEKMALPIIFDGRNQYNHKGMLEMGFEYYSIGR
ncbi:MAG: UDP-glucose/GDP-mannose dehydrogenase family protein [Sphaerochaetaceae bacterium]